MQIISPRQQTLLETLKSQQLSHHLKSAASDAKKTFEENFALLTDSIMDEHFPRLKKYDLGFQLVDKSPDNTKAFGVRALRLRSLAFIPFFYNNGTVGGYEMMYVPKLNLFFPASEPWIVYMTTKADSDLGVPDDKLKEYYATLYPNLLSLRRPIIFKSGSVNNERLLPKYLKKYAVVGKRLCVFIDKAPWLLEKLAKFYGPEILPLIKESALREDIQPKYVKTALIQHEINKKIRFYTENDPTEKLSDLDIKEREELFKRGYLIKDARDESETSKAIPAIKKTTFFSVDSPGVYKVLRSDMTPVNVTVAFLDDELCAFLPNGKRLRLNDARNDAPLVRLYAIEKVGDFTDSDLVKEVAGDSLPREADVLYVFDKNGKGYSIFAHSETIYSPETDRIGIVVIPRNKFDVKRVIVLPRKVYTINVKDRGDTSVNDVPFISPAALDSLLSKQAELIKVSYDSLNNQYILNNKSCSRFDLLHSLVKEYGLREKQALEIIRNAEINKTARYWVKLAEPFEIRQRDNPNVYFPDAPKGQWAPGFVYSSKLEADLWVPGLKRPQPIVNIMEPPSPEILKKVKQLADSNDGEAFDLGLISSLLYTTNIDDYTPQVIKGLDGMCRILFALYRHQDEMKERYGDEDYKKIVESLKTNIENVGELVVDLSQRKIDPYINALEAEQQIMEVE